MNCRDVILQILGDRDLAEADGRPLYAYRCSNAEFATLQHTLRVELGSGLRHASPGPFVAQAFCLWGAEWWRRNHHGGHWAWEDLLASVGCEDYGPGQPFYRRLCELVATGVRRWRRDLLRIAIGRAFLVTLACEGGLPLNLVLNEQARLRRFFQTLLEEIRLFGPAGILPEELAERVDHLLPRSLRQDVVYKLSGDLAARIWQLQGEVGQSETPLRDLDRMHPGWRDRLPLSIEDDVARALLNNLLLDAADVARGGSKRIRWVRPLVKTTDGYQLRGELILPGTMRPEDVKLLWPHVDPIPRRFEIWLEHEGTPPAVVAFATQRSSGSKAGEAIIVFALEHISGNETIIGAGVAAKGTTLVMRALNVEAATNAFSGAAPLADLPWVFEEPSEGDDRLRQVGEGSTSVRADAAVVALSTNTHIEATDGSVVELGVLDKSDRKVVRVRGAAVFRDSDGNRVNVRTGAPNATEAAEYRFEGVTLELGRSRRTCYLGQPKLRAYRPEGISTLVNATDLQWKPDLGPPNWLRWGAGCVGEGVVRLVEGGSTSWSSRLCILPSGARVELRPGSSTSSGELVLSGFSGADVTLDELSSRVDFSAWTENTSDIVVGVKAEGRAPNDLHLLVRWPKQGEAHLVLPFPALDARFEREGSDGHEEILESDPVVALNHLPRVRAVVVAPDRGGGYEVLGSFRDEGVSPSHMKGTLLLELQETTAGLHEQGMGMLQQAIASRFAFSDSPWAHVRLNLHSNTVDLPYRALRVERFDLELRRVGDDSKVRVSSDSVGQLPTGVLDNLRVEAIPLLTSAAPVVLGAAHAPYMWEVPEANLEPGPWLIVAWDGDWCRAHPLWWFVPPERSETPETPHPLLELFRGEESSDRRTACVRLIEELRADTSHAAWPLIDAQVELTQHLPAATLDVLCALAKDPEAAALAALRAPSEKHFVRLWRALETLPFWWRAVTAEDWLSAASTYAAGLQGKTLALAEVLGKPAVAALIRSPFDRSVGRVISELSHLAPVLARATARCFSEQPGDDLTRLHREHIRHVLLAQRQPLLTNAYEYVSGMSRYPDLVCVTEIAQSLTDDCDVSGLWRREAGRSTHDLAFQVHNAPIAAALCAAQGRRLSDAELFSLRTAFELAPWWFGEVFELTFLCAYGMLSASRIRQHLSS
jgi:hypothetical protein